jgi:hypothetical protein
MQVSQSIMLVLVQGEAIRFLLREITIKCVTCQIVLQEQPDLLFDSITFLNELPIGPPKDPPAEVHQAVLLEQVIAELLRRDYGAISPVPVLTIDLKGILAATTNEGVVDIPSAVIDIPGRILVREIADNLYANRFLEYIDKELLGSRFRVITTRLVVSQC